jgi:hypothetical protein
MLRRGGKPYSIVRRTVALVAQYEDNLVLNKDGEAAEHGASPGRERSNRVEHKCMRYDLALFGGEESAVLRERGEIATSLRARFKTSD